MQCLKYILFVLKIDMGNKIPLIYLSGVAGSVTGVSLGFFIGSAGRMSDGVKLGLSMAFSMVCCFFSGLMAGNMKAIIDQHCPVINKILKRGISRYKHTLKRVIIGYLTCI